MTKASGATYVTIYPAEVSLGLQIIDTARRTDLEGGDELGKSYYQKVEIEEEFELLVKGQGEERRYGVLLIANNIGRIEGLPS